MGKCAMTKELNNLAEKEEEQPTKAPNSTFKITKAEEAIVKSFKFYSPNFFLNLINSPFEAELNNGELTSLFKPPTV